MSNLKQRLENLEKSSVHGAATHEDFILHCMEHGPAESVSTITDEEIDAFLHPNQAELNHAKS